MAEVAPAFLTLRDVGYESCAHPRTKVNVSGELHLPIWTCLDCGATPDKAGSLDFYRLGHQV